MTEPTPNASELESTDDMDTADIMKQADKVANAKSSVVLNYIMIAVLSLFVATSFLQWRQNSTAPDRLIGILEKNSTDNSQNLKVATDSLKVQEKSLDKITEFAIQVPMEHRDMAVKQASTHDAVLAAQREQAELRAAVKSNTEAVQKNTEAVSKLISVIEIRIGQDPNDRPPPN